MSALTNTNWNSRSDASLAAVPFPIKFEGISMRDKLNVVRDTILVLGLQIVFRAMMAMRRWNY